MSQKNRKRVTHVLVSECVCVYGVCKELYEEVEMRVIYIAMYVSRDMHMDIYTHCMDPVVTNGALMDAH